MKNWIFVLLFAFSVFQTACSGCSKESYDYSVHCNPGTYRCQNDSSMYCNNNYEWQLNEACSGGCDKSTGKCTQPPDEEPEPDNEEENDEDIELCEISDSFETSEYENYFLVKGSGTLVSLDNINAPEAIRLKMALYNEDYPNLSFSSSDKSTYTHTQIWTVDKNAYENTEEKAIDVKLHSRDTIIDDFSNPIVSYSVKVEAFLTESDMRKVENGEIADFAPHVYVSEVITALHYDEENTQLSFKLSKSCLIGKSTGEIPVGKFQYCMDENGGIEVGNEIKLGIDASISIAPEEIAEDYAQRGSDSCYCFDLVDENSVARDCPENFCDAIECKEVETVEGEKRKTVCVETDKTEKNPTGYTCILVCDDETEVYNESYRTCECKEGYEKDQETQKCIEKTDNCKDVTCGENKVCKENSNVDAGYECVCDEENGYIADPSGEGCRLL